MKDKKRIVLGTRSLPKNIQEEQDYISRGSIYVSHATTMYRRDLALEIGGYREFFRFGSEDHDFFARLGAKTQITNYKKYYFGVESMHQQASFGKAIFPTERTICIELFCVYSRLSGIPSGDYGHKPLHTQNTAK